MQMDQSPPPTPDARHGQDQSAVAEVAGQAQEKAQQAAGQVQERLRAQLDQRFTQLSGQVGEQASGLRSVGEVLHEQGTDGPANLAEQLAGYAERVARYLHEKDAGAVLSDAEGLGRRQPWAVAAGGVALGFAASRFLKASSSQRYHGPDGQGFGGQTTVSRPAGVYTAGQAATVPTAGAPGSRGAEVGVPSTGVRQAHTMVAASARTPGAVG
jgi:hypothetical protein